MNTASIVIKTNKDTKVEAQELAKELGLSLSSVMNAFLKQFVRTKSVNVSVVDRKLSKSLLEAMRDAQQALKEETASPLFDNPEDNLNWLQKQGI